MFTAYDGQRFDTVEKCEAHNNKVKEKLIKEQEEKRLAESKRGERLTKIKSLGTQLTNEIKEYEKEYGVAVTVLGDETLLRFLNSRWTW